MIEPNNTADTLKNVVVHETGRGRFQQEVAWGSHRLIADEPTDVGGLGSGFGPYELLLASLGACTAMTLRLYADQKHWPLKGAQIRLRHLRIHAEDCAECETKQGMLDLEDGIARAELIIAVRLLEVSESKIVHGGKLEVVTAQYRFEPVRTLKGIYARDALLMTSYIFPSHGTCGLLSCNLQARPTLHPDRCRFECEGTRTGRHCNV